MEIRCQPLPWFDRNHLESVRHAFTSAAALPFQQAWLPEAEADFCPGEVRLGWRERSLMVFAEMTDREIFNDATGPNERLWESGDVFEMFFKSFEMESYVEFQVTPHDQRLQLRFPDVQAVGQARESGRFADFMIQNDLFLFQTWIDSGRNRWLVYAEIPTTVVCGSDEPIENTRWRFSFGRYDHTRGLKEPVISSTSSHARPDFHRQHEWDTLIFKTHL